MIYLIVESTSDITAALSNLDLPIVVRDLSSDLLFNLNERLIPDITLPNLNQEHLRKLDAKPFYDKFINKKRRV